MATSPTQHLPRSSIPSSHRSSQQQRPSIITTPLLYNMPGLTQKQHDQFCCVKSFAQNRPKAVQFKIVNGVERSKVLHSDVNILKTEAPAKQKSRFIQSSLWGEMTGNPIPVWKIKPSTEEFMDRVRLQSSIWSDCDGLRLGDGEVMRNLLLYIQELICADQFVTYKTARFDEVSMSTKRCSLPPCVADTRKTVPVKIVFTYYAINPEPLVPTPQQSTVVSSFLQVASDEKVQEFKFSSGDGHLPLGADLRKCYSDVPQVVHSDQIAPPLRISQSEPRGDMKLTKKEMPPSKIATPPIEEEGRPVTPTSPKFIEIVTQAASGLEDASNSGDESNSKSGETGKRSTPVKPFADFLTATSPCDDMSTNTCTTTYNTTFSRSTESTVSTKTPVKTPTKTGYEEVDSDILVHIPVGTLALDPTKPNPSRKTEKPFFSGADTWKVVKAAREAIEETWYLPRPMLTDPNEYLILDAEEKHLKKHCLSPIHFKNFTEFLKYKQRMISVEKHDAVHGRKVSISTDIPQSRDTDHASLYQETVYGRFTPKRGSDSPDSVVLEEHQADFLTEERRQSSLKQSSGLKQSSDLKQTSDTFNALVLKKRSSTENLRRKLRIKKIRDSIPEPTHRKKLLMHRLDRFMYETYLPGMQQRLFEKMKQKKVKLTPLLHKKAEDLNLEPKLTESFLEAPIPEFFNHMQAERWKTWLVDRVKELVVRQEQITYADCNVPMLTCLTFSLPPPTYLP